MDTATRTRVALRVAAAALTAALLAGAAFATAQSSAQVAAPTPAEIVAARQAAYHLSGAAMGNIKAAIDRGDDPRRQAYAARGVARWARVLPTLFPDSTATITPSRARPAIWENRADFNAKAAAYAEAAGRLAEAAASGDRAAFAAAFNTTRATCSACHDVYQVPQEAPR